MRVYIWTYFPPIFPEIDSFSSCLWGYLKNVWYSITCLSHSEYTGTNAQMLHFQRTRASVPACRDEDNRFSYWLDHGCLCSGDQKRGWYLCGFPRMCPPSFCTWKFYLNVTVWSVRASGNLIGVRWCYRSVQGDFDVSPMCQIYMLALNTVQPQALCLVFVRCGVTLLLSTFLPGRPWTEAWRDTFSRTYKGRITSAFTKW